MRALTIGLVVLMALTAFEALAIATAMPVVAQALDGVSLYALSFSSTLAASLVGMVVAGHCCDRHGAAPALWSGVALFVAGLLLSGLAPAMGWLLGGRIVQGLGSGAISVVSYVIVARAYAPALRPRVFAAFSAAWVIPSLFGPSVSALIVQHLSWRAVFLLVPLVAIPAALALRRGLRELAPAPRSGESFASPMHRHIGWAIIAASSACLLDPVSRSRTPGGIALLAAILVALLISALRLLPDGTLRAGRGLPSVIALHGLCSAAFFGTEVFIPLMLSREYGLSAFCGGAVLTLGALGWSASSWYQGHARRAGSRTHLLRAGMGLLALGIALVAASAAVRTVSSAPPANGSVLADVIAGWSIAGLGMGLTSPSLSVLTLALSPPSEQGRNSSAMALSQALATAVALALGGALFARLLEDAPEFAYLASFGVTGALAVLGFCLSSRTRGT
ncbi:MAG: MFS transporter [Dokdonella sp.]